MRASRLLEPGTQWRAISAYVVLGSSAGIAVLAYLSALFRGGDISWVAGEWLINYADGFIRRGLFGSMLLSVAPSGTALLVLLFLVQMAIFAVVLIHFLRFLHREKFSAHSIALACSPAGVAFWGWSYPGGFRKESLVFVALVLLSARRQAGRPWVANGLLVGSLAFFVVAFFSWEPSALLIPPALYLLLADSGQRNQIGRRVGRAAGGMLVILGGLALGLSFLFPGDGETASVVCQAIADRGVDPTRACRGAVAALGWNLSVSLSAIAERFPLYLGYLPLFLLALAPIVSSGWARHNWRWILATVVFTLPLYVIAVDYGRWIYVTAVVLSICAASAPRSEQESIFSKSTVAALLFVTTWGLPPFVDPHATSWPWYGFLASFIEGLAGIKGV